MSQEWPLAVRNFLREHELKDLDRWLQSSHRVTVFFTQRSNNEATGADIAARVGVLARIKRENAYPGFFFCAVRVETEDSDTILEFLGGRAMIERAVLPFVLTFTVVESFDKSWVHWDMGECYIDEWEDKLDLFNEMGLQETSSSEWIFLFSSWKSRFKTHSAQEKVGPTINVSPPEPAFTIVRRNSHSRPLDPGSVRFRPVSRTSSPASSWAVNSSSDSSNNTKQLSKPSTSVRSKRRKIDRSGNIFIGSNRSDTSLCVPSGSSGYMYSGGNGNDYLNASTISLSSIPRQQGPKSLRDFNKKTSSIFEAPPFSASVLHNHFNKLEVTFIGGWTKHDGKERAWSVTSVKGQSNLSVKSDTISTYCSEQFIAPVTNQVGSMKAENSTLDKIDTAASSPNLIFERPEFVGTGNAPSIHEEPPDESLSPEQREEISRLLCSSNPRFLTAEEVRVVLVLKCMSASILFFTIFVYYCPADWVETHRKELVKFSVAVHVVELVTILGYLTGVPPRTSRKNAIQIISRICNTPQKYPATTASTPQNTPMAYVPASSGAPAPSPSTSSLGRSALSAFSSVNPSAMASPSTSLTTSQSSLAPPSQNFLDFCFPISRFGSRVFHWHTLSESKIEQAWTDGKYLCALREKYKDMKSRKCILFRPWKTLAAVSFKQYDYEPLQPEIVFCRSEAITKTSEPPHGLKKLLDKDCQEKLADCIEYRHVWPDGSKHFTTELWTIRRDFQLSGLYDCWYGIVFVEAWSRWYFGASLAFPIIFGLSVMSALWKYKSLDLAMQFAGGYFGLVSVSLAGFCYLASVPPR